MGIEDSKIVNEVLKDLAHNTQKNCKTALRQFMRFINNGAERGFSIDEVIREVEADTKLAQEHIDNFYKWLQNKKVAGYQLRGKTMKESSAYQKAYSSLLGFFANLDISFERKWKKSFPKPERRQAIKKDKLYTFFDVDEKTRTIRFNRERMQQFLSNLKPRDVAITLALLSSSQDSGDLFKVNIGDINEQQNNRIFLEGYRGKSKVPFRTFISKEATRFIRRYIQQERRKAGDEEPLFVYRGSQRMTSNHLSSIYRNAARKMGIKLENGEQNPLRPKRMRHLFRTACDTAGITELYTNAYMGHKNHQGQDYSEFSKAVLELEYLRVEPFLTVYGQVEESLEIKEDVRKLENRIAELNSEIRFLRDNIGRIARDAVQMELKMLYGEDYESLQETYRWQKEFMRREREKSST